MGTFARIAVGAVAAAGITMLWTGPAMAGTNAGITHRVTANGTPTASVQFNHVTDSLTVCDLLEDGFHPVGTVDYVVRDSEGRETRTTVITAVDSTVDGNCITVSDDLIENHLLLVGLRLHRNDGSPTSLGGSQWALA